MQKQSNQNSFAGQMIYAGIDIHLKSWKVTILSEHYEHKTFSQDPNPDLLASYLHRHFPEAEFKAVYEAGFSGFVNCRSLRELGIPCEVVHPADVPTTSKEKQLKSDKTDSRKLARSLRDRSLKFIHVPDQQLEADRSLVRQRHRVVKDLTRLKNRVKSLLMQFGIEIPERFGNGASRHWSKSYIQWLTDLSIKQESLKQTVNNYIQWAQILRQQLLLLNKQVKNLAQQKRYLADYQRVLSIPGVGLMTAITFLVEIGDIRRFKRIDELCSFVGLIPSMRGSGDKMVTGKLINRGRKQLKIMLIEASWEAVRKDPALMWTFNECIKRMPKNKAIIRVARKMLNRMYSILKNQNMYTIGISK